jgi:ADP-ribose pyrophosphatase
MAFEPEVRSTEVLATGQVFDVERVEFALRDGAGFTREIVRHPGAVAILAFDGADVVLVRQWRAPFGACLLEIPAGTRDAHGEDPASTALRELEEEAGIRAACLETLCTVWNSPGWTDQTTVIYLATGLTAVPRRPAGPEEEAMEVIRLGLDEAVAQLRGPGPVDASTAVAILALARREGL